MAIVLFVFAAGLFVAAGRSRGGMRTLLVLIALANIGGAMKMLADGYPYATRTQPHLTPPGIDEPSHP